jgi:protoporphyrinogen oxidase
VLLDRSLHEVIKHIAKDLTGKIRLSWPVEAIEYSEAGAVVYGPGGARIKCAHVVVSGARPSFVASSMT